MFNICIFLLEIFIEISLTSLVSMVIVFLQFTYTLKFSSPYVYLFLSRGYSTANAINGLLVRDVNIILV